ncbi:hypothetical protein PCK1_002159 [Pneumocystis canis]|nr:hypothetical protein PCK1_002159 [Pneumocystis canis]
MYTGKAAIRTVKNLKYSDVQNKVRSATSNDPWGPSGADMSEIARMTFDPHSFVEIMDMLDRRMNDKGKNWRHVFKALTVLDYCLHSGSENIVKWAKDNIYIIKTLREFNYISDDGKDQGSNVRIKARDITELLQDDERLRLERKNHIHMHDRLGFKYDNNYGIPNNASQKKSPYGKSPKYDLSDDDKELQYAIEESKLQSEDDKRRSMLKAKQEEEELALALQLSKEEEQLRQMALIQKQKEDLLLEKTYQQPQQMPAFFDNQIFNSIQQQPQNIDYMKNMHLSASDIFQVKQSPNTQNIGFYQSQANYSQLNYPQIDYSQFQQTMQTNNPYSTLIDTQSSHRNISFDNSYTNRSDDQFKSLKIGLNNPFIQMSNSDSYKNNFNTINFPLDSYQGQKGESNRTIRSAQNLFFPEKSNTSYQEKLSALLQSGNPGIDTFGNVGDLRIPSQHTVGESVNSYGVRIKTEPTGTGAFYNQKMNSQVNQQINQQIPFNRQPILPAPTGVGFKNFPLEQNHMAFPPADHSASLTAIEANPYDSCPRTHTSHSQTNPQSGRKLSNSPNSRLSVNMKNSMLAPSAKKPRNNIVYSQPDDSGIGNHLQSQLYYALEYLKKCETPKTSKEISSYLSMPLTTEFIDRLQTNERIEYDPHKDTYYFKPIYNIRSAASLVAFLNSSVTAVGVLVKDLKEGWSGAIDEIERLEKDGQILVLRTKKDGFAKSVWPNHSEGQESVDDEFKTIWHSLTIPSPSDLPRELEKVGLKPTSIDPATIKKIPVTTNLQKHKKRRNHRGRITNTHLNSLKDYSDRRL